MTDQASQQVVLEAMASLTDLAATRTASRLWLTPRLRVGLHLDPEGISHIEAATTLHSRQVVLVQETPKAGVTELHKLTAGTHVLLDLAYSDRKHDRHAVLSPFASAHRLNYTAYSCCLIIQHLLAAC